MGGLIKTYLSYDIHFEEDAVSLDQFAVVGTVLCLVVGSIPEGARGVSVKCEVQVHKQQQVRRTESCIRERSLLWGHLA